MRRVKIMGLGGAEQASRGEVARTKVLSEFERDVQELKESETSESAQCLQAGSWLRSLPLSSPPSSLLVDYFLHSHSPWALSAPTGDLPTCSLSHPHCCIPKRQRCSLSVLPPCVPQVPTQWPHFPTSQQEHSQLITCGCLGNLDCPSNISFLIPL